MDRAKPFKILTSSERSPLSEEGKQNHFVPVDTKEGLLLLKEAARATAQTIIWTKEQNQQIHSRISAIVESEKELFAWNPPDFNPHEFMDTMAQNKVEDCYFSANLNRATIFFKAKFKHPDAAGLCFHLPEKVFKVQRRQFLRFPIPELYKMLIEIEDPIDPSKTLSKQILDISAGGVALIVSHAESPEYQVGAKIEFIRLKVHQTQIDCKGEVRHLSKIEQGPHKGKYRVGVAFVDIKPQFSDTIAKYVFDESRKYFSRIF